MKVKVLSWENKFEHITEVILCYENGDYKHYFMSNPLGGSGKAEFDINLNEILEKEKEANNER